MNRRVWVTRDEELDGPQSAALRAVGLEPVLEPVLERRVVGDAGAMTAGLGSGDWLAVTSAFAARAMGRHTGEQAFGVAAVGEATARELRSMGYEVGLISSDATRASLWPALWERASAGALVRYPRSSLAKAPEAPAGVRIEAPVLYETGPREFDRSVVASVAAVALTSPSAVERVAGMAGLPACASIGPATSAAMRAHGLPVWLESEAHTFADLAARIAAGLERLNPPGRT